MWVDLCWAWSINPKASREFLRHYLHAAPINELFAFGGDTMRPRAAIAYSMQARNHIAQALNDEVTEGQIGPNISPVSTERISVYV